MLEALTNFSSNHLDGKAKEQSDSVIGVCQTNCETFEEVLSTRPLTNTLMRTFWKADESPEIEKAREQLGDSLSRACAATLYHAVLRVGMESPFGQEIDSSAAVFVNELKQAW